MRKIIYAGIFSVLIANGEIPKNYYSSLSGKSGETLKEAVKAVAFTSDFNQVEYGNSGTWAAFLHTDTRIINGVEVWWDMYSNVAVPISTTESLNIEHSVANSWFGGTAAQYAYADLMHLNPSNQEANNMKSNLPLGEVQTASYNNGLVKVGTPKAGTAGSASKVFEPADEYKGDFARAYFYIFTVYDKEKWKIDQPMFSFNESVALEPWAVDMLLRWAKEDPVDSKEINRNEEIYKIQKNRNPFIDYPELIDYIWGEKKTESFTPGETASAIDRPAEPVFTGCRVVGVNRYSSRWWEQNIVPISHEEGDLWVSVNGGDYEQFGPGVSVPAASSHGAVHSLAAYTATEHNGKTFRSSVATLTLTARDPEKDDYTEALYVPVTTQTDFQPDDNTYYIIRSASNGHIMGHNNTGTASKGFQPDAGTIEFANMSCDHDINGIPTEAALVKFKPTAENKYTIEILDALHQKSKGFWNIGTGKNNNHGLDSNIASAATVSIDENGNATITFDGGRVLQYNKTQPRFTNYTGTQADIKLARFSKFLDIPSGVTEEIEENEAIVIDGNNIHLPYDWSLYDLQGRRSSGKVLSAGIYIARSPKGKAVKVFIP